MNPVLRELIDDLRRLGVAALRQALRASRQRIQLRVDPPDHLVIALLTVERGGQAIASAETSDFGEFTLAGVTPGVYDLRLAADEREIVLAATPLSLD